MKKILRTIILFTVCCLVIIISGCTGEKNKYKNLDLEDTVVIENVPESGEWFVMKFDYARINANSYDILKEASKPFGVTDLKKEKILCNVVFSDDERGDVVYTEMTDEDYAQTTFLRYVDDDFFICYNLSNRIEMYNRKTLREIKHENYDSLWEWKPGLTGEHYIKSYDLSDGADILDVYVLNGTQVSVSDALKYANDLINSGDLAHAASKLFTYTPISADVIALTESDHAYEFLFGLNYDNVPIDASGAVGASDNNLKHIFSNRLKLCMFTQSSVDYMWSCPMSFDAPTESEECSIAVTYEDACRILSENLSQEYVFKVEKAELIYCVDVIYYDTEEPPRSEYFIEPTWQFTVRSDIQGYKKMCVNVNAVNGEFETRQFV